MARTEQIKQEVWKRRADGCTGSSNSRDLYFYFLLFKSCDLTEKATSGTTQTQTQTLCKRRQRMNSRPCQVAATSHLWAVAGSILGPVLNNSPHSLRALWWAGWALPSLQGILALPAMGQVSVSTKKNSRPWRIHPAAIGCSRHCWPLPTAYAAAPVSLAYDDNWKCLRHCWGSRHLTTWRQCFYQNFLHDLSLDNA